MPRYRAYVLDDDGHMAGAVEFDCADDEEASERANIATGCRVTPFRQRVSGGAMLCIYKRQHGNPISPRSRRYSHVPKKLFKRQTNNAANSNVSLEGKTLSWGPYRAKAESCVQFKLMQRNGWRPKAL